MKNIKIGVFKLDGLMFAVFNDGTIKVDGISCQIECLVGEARRLAQNLIDDYNDTQDWLQACEQTEL